jgi:hypothetical protein
MNYFKKNLAESTKIVPINANQPHSTEIIVLCDYLTISSQASQRHQIVKKEEE